MSTTGSSLADEAEPVSQGPSNNTGEALEVERERDVPINADQGKDSTPEVAHAHDSITVPLHTVDVHEYKETQEAQGSNGNEASQASPQRCDHDRAVAAYNLCLLGDEYQFQHESRKALKAFEDALQLYRELDNRPRIARCLRMIGECQSRSVFHRNQATTTYTDAAKIYRELGDKRDAAQCVQMVGKRQWDEGRCSEALNAYNEVLELYRELDDPLEVARCLHMIGEVERIQGQYEAGVSAYTEAYKLFLGLDDQLGVAESLSMIGACKRLVPGLSQEALVAFREASQYHQKLYHGRGRDGARCIQMIGECHRKGGRYEEAQDTYKEASAAYENQAISLEWGTVSA
ncbi:hypothetical protein FRB93_013369 [Tulasnella sp. JGI-2019a]|nr:hypothetical protein FRB93_013369 [Tulasnella sp. JGI-2019a]